MVSDRFRLRYKLTPDDWKAFVRVSFRRMRTGYAWKDFLLLMVLYGVTLGAVALLPLAGLMTEQAAAHLFMGIPIGMVLFMIMLLVINARYAARRFAERDTLLGEFRLVAYEGGGIQVTGEHVHSSYDWSAFVDVTQTPKLIVLWLGRASGMIISTKAFANDDEIRSFVDFVNERIAAQKTTDVLPASE